MNVNLSDGGLAYPIKGPTKRVPTAQVFRKLVFTVMSEKQVSKQTLPFSFGRNFFSFREVEDSIDPSLERTKLLEWFKVEKKSYTFVSLDKIFPCKDKQLTAN